MIDRAAVERFAGLSAAEQDEVMKAGRRIETVDDLDGLAPEDAERVRQAIEGCG